MPVDDAPDQSIVPVDPFSEENMPGNVLSKILAFVGRGRYRFMSAVNKRFQISYKWNFGFSRRTFGSVLAQSIGTAKLAIEECPELKPVVTRWAAKQGKLAVLQWAREEGLPWDGWTCASAAAYGDLEILKWLRENGCEWDEWTCSFAASYNRLHVLKWARRNGCKWNSWTCRNAARGGHLKLLKWARKKGCPWDEGTKAVAATRGYVEDHNNAIEVNSVALTNSTPSACHIG